MGWKIIPRIRLTSAKMLVEVEAELGKKYCFEIKIARKVQKNIVGYQLFAL